MFKFVMLVKLAFAMQRLTKHLKNFCHDQQTKTLFTIETKIGFTDDDFVKFDHGQIIWSTLVKN